MKFTANFLPALILYGVVSSTVVISQPALQSGKLIPVYPGAALKSETESGDSRMCCSFAVKDNFDKVVGFYENALKIKPLDSEGLAAQLPFLKTQVEEMLKQMPSGMKIRFFVLHIAELQGQKGAELFEVVNTGQGTVEFQINPSQFTADDSHFESEWEVIDSDKEMGTSSVNSVSWKILAAALPSSGPSGYQKDELVIDELTSTSVNVTYNKDAEGGADNKSISVTIYDSSGSPDDPMDQVTPQYENEKAVKVKGKYPGKESTVMSGNKCSGADKIFLVKNRFLIVFSAYNMCDFNVINQLIDKMNIESLEQ